MKQYKSLKKKQYKSLKFRLIFITEDKKKTKIEIENIYMHN